jgi:glycine/D-amino acid oxidase-like deaminating enzyme
LLPLIAKFAPIHSIEHDVKDAELTDTGGMHFAVDQEQLKDLTDYYERMEQLGLNADGHMVFWGPRLAKINSCCPKAQGGIYYRRVGQARPAYVVFKLCDLVHQRGGNVQTQTKVNKVSKQRSEGHKYVVHTNRGDIECEHVVYASNAFTSGLLPELKEIIVPTRGQMIVTSPLKNFELPMNVWINRGYEYLNQRPDGRLCAGGMRWKADGKESGVFDDSQVNKKVGEALRTMLVDYFPALSNEKFTVDYGTLRLRSVDCLAFHAALIFFRIQNGLV